MTLAPQLYTYQSTDAPEKERWLARWIGLPMIFFGRTKEGAVLAAEAFWAMEQAKEAAKRKAAVDRSERARGRSAGA